MVNPMPRRVQGTPPTTLMGIRVELPSDISNAALEGLEFDLRRLPDGFRDLVEIANFSIQVLPQGQKIPGAPEALGRTDGKKRIIYMRQDALPLPNRRTGHFRVGIHELGHALDKAVLNAALMGAVMGPAGIALSKAHYEFTRDNFEASASRPPLDKLGRAGTSSPRDVHEPGSSLLLSRHAGKSRGEHWADSFEAFLTDEPPPLNGDQQLLEAAVNRSRGDLARFNSPMMEHIGLLVDQLRSETLSAPVEG